MTPEQNRQLKHVELFQQFFMLIADPESLKTLEDIEITVKDKSIAHVTPEIGFFYLS